MQKFGLHINKEQAERADTGFSFEVFFFETTVFIMKLFLGSLAVLTLIILIGAKFTEAAAPKSTAVNSKIYAGCSKNKTCWGVPKGCIAKKKCSQVAAWRSVKNGVAFELSGPSNASFQYVAMGINTKAAMNNASVVICKLGGKTGRVDVGLAQHPAKGTAKVKYVSTKQILQGSMSVKVSNGNFYCQFTRKLKVSLYGRSFDLHKKKYYAIMSRGKLKPDGNATYHGPNRFASANTYRFNSVDKTAHACLSLVLGLGAIVALLK